MSIHLDAEKNIAYPGSWFTGVIQPRPKSGEVFDVKTFTVRLVGVCKTRVVIPNGVDEDIYESSETFLEIQKPVLQTRLLISLGTILPSTLRFPHDSASDYVDPFDALLGPDLKRETRKQSLPPSGYFGTGSTITYSFDVLLIDEISHERFTASKSIEFSRTREVAVPDPQIITTVQEKILAGQDRIAKQSCLKLALNSPQVLIPKQKFPLMLRHIVDNVDTEGSSTPTVLLRSSIVQLVEKTVIRSDNDLENQSTELYEIASRKYLSADSKSGAPWITSQGLDLGAFLRNPSLSHNYAPTFECALTQLTYCLNVLLEVESGEEKIEFAFELGPVRVLPSETTDQVRKREEEEAWNDPGDLPPSRWG